MDYLKPIQFSSTYLEQNPSKELSTVCCTTLLSIISMEILYAARGCSCCPHTMSVHFIEIHTYYRFFKGISSACTLNEYVIAQLCRGMIQEAGRSFCGLLDYMVVSKRKSVRNTRHLHKIIHFVISTLSSTVFL